MKVNEIFYSVQGEGYFTGTPALFIRLSGCNLKCPFCDTQHQEGKEMSEDDIIALAESCPARLVVVTGGEPALQLTGTLVSSLKEIGKFVAVETNGTRPLPRNIDWVTVSPKCHYVQNAELFIREAEEVKVVMDSRILLHEPDCGIAAIHYFVQPCDTGNEERNRENMEHCVNFVKSNPKWRISLQTQKILNVR